MVFGKNRCHVLCAPFLKNCSNTACFQLSKSSYFNKAALFWQKRPKTTVFCTKIGTSMNASKHFGNFYWIKPRLHTFTAYYSAHNAIWLRHYRHILRTTASPEWMLLSVWNFVHCAFHVFHSLNTTVAPIASLQHYIHLIPCLFTYSRPNVDMCQKLAPSL